MGWSRKRIRACSTQTHTHKGHGTWICSIVFVSIYVIRFYALVLRALIPKNCEHTTCINHVHTCPINPCALFFSLLLLLLLAHVIAIITALNTSALVCCVGYHFKLFVCRFFPLVGGWLLSSFIRVGDGVGWWDHLAWHIFSLYFVFLFLPRNMRGQTNARTSHTQTRYSRYVRHSFGWMVFFNQYVLVVKHFSAIFVQCIAIGFWRPRACY